MSLAYEYDHKYQVIKELFFNTERRIQSIEMSFDVVNVELYGFLKEISNHLFSTITSKDHQFLRTLLETDRLLHEISIHGT